MSDNRSSLATTKWALAPLSTRWDLKPLDAGRASKFVGRTNYRRRKWVAWPKLRIGSVETVAKGRLRVEFRILRNALVRCRRRLVKEHGADGITTWKSALRSRSDERPKRWHHGRHFAEPPRSHRTPIGDANNAAPISRPVQPPASRQRRNWTSHIDSSRNRACSDGRRTETDNFETGAIRRCATKQYKMALPRSRPPVWRAEREVGKSPTAATTPTNAAPATPTKPQRRCTYRWAIIICRGSGEATAIKSVEPSDLQAFTPCK